MSSVCYYCPCLSPASDPPPPPHLASSSASFHPLSDLYFCEECDAVRCNSCVSVEVSGYYCPNCLFEVPSASVRAEKNRCARNCFLCPQCNNTLAIVPSDPQGIEWDTKANPPQLGALNDPPFLLYCNSCRWDSAEVGITFEKPTGIAVQMQKYEDAAPDSLEFERLKEHFEPYLRNQLSNSGTAPTLGHSASMNPATAAAASALARDIPGIGHHHQQRRGRGHKNEKAVGKEDLMEYRSRIEVGAGGVLGMGGGDEDTDFMRLLEEVNEVAALDRRWSSSWTPSLHSSDLLPLRMPLHIKKTKRCHVCRHILIKPEQKAQTVRYKMRLVASTFLPSIEVFVQHPQSTSSGATSNLTASLRRSAASKPAAPTSTEEPDSSAVQFHAGRSYPFKLSLTNPLYDPISVKLTVQRSGLSKKKPSFAISLPTSAIPVAAYQEDWEYDDEDEEGMDDEPPSTATRERFGIEGGSGRGSIGGPGAGAKGAGILEKKANTTVLGGEVMIGKEGKGDVKFNMIVAYTYRSDETSLQQLQSSTSGKGGGHKQAPEMKTFSFGIVVHLGSIIPREEPVAPLMNVGLASQPATATDEEFGSRVKRASAMVVDD